MQKNLICKYCLDDENFAQELYKTENTNKNLLQIIAETFTTTLQSC